MSGSLSLSLPFARPVLRRPLFCPLARAWVNSKKDGSCLNDFYRLWIVHAHLHKQCNKPWPHVNTSLRMSCSSTRVGMPRLLVRLQKNPKIRFILHKTFVNDVDVKCCYLPRLTRSLSCANQMWGGYSIFFCHLYSQVTPVRCIKTFVIVSQAADSIENKQEKLVHS